LNFAPAEADLDGGMTVGAREKYRTARRNFIQVMPSREPRRFPKRFDPAAPSNPFAAPGSHDALFHFRQKIFARVRASRFRVISRLPIPKI